MKKVLSTVAALTFFVGVAANVNALPIPDEWEQIHPTNIVADGNQFVPGQDLGYFVWTDTDARMNWHIAMNGEGHPSDMFFGEVVLENADGIFGTVKWEGNDFIVSSDEHAGFFAVANVHYDQIDITITDYTLPSFIGMDLNILGYGNNADLIFLGQDRETVGSLGSDDDFKIAAPVPEPATMFLFGTGLVGLMGWRKRKNN